MGWFEGGTIDNDGIDTAFNGVFKDVFVASFSGVGDLAFTGKGITTLAAENTYTGNTNILGGTLRVSGTLSNFTAVSISMLRMKLLTAMRLVRLLVLVRFEFLTARY